MTCVAFSIKFAKTNQKFAENSEFCEKKFTIIQNYSLHSLLRSRAPRCSWCQAGAPPADNPRSPGPDRRAGQRRRVPGARPADLDLAVKQEVREDQNVRM